MCGYSILSNARVICMHDGLWYGITVQLMQTISTYYYYGAINTSEEIHIKELLLSNGGGWFENVLDWRKQIICIGMVLKKKWKSLTFLRERKKRRKLSKNDICVYPRLFRKYGAKLPCQKKAMGVLSRWDGNSAGESGTCIVCTQELTGRSRNYDPGRVSIESLHEFG